VAPPPGRELRSDLLALLSEPNIASKEELVRQYDHEVQARSVTKPFSGVRDDGPSDGAVLRINLSSRRGITVTHGVCPRFGDYDTYRMAMCAVDEAFRAHVACGGDPDRAAALDNFCWPDPVASPDNPDGEYKLAQLVRAGRGLKRACLAYGLPLISGKDSMKNDALMEGRKVSIRPTLLISLVGVVPDIRRSPAPDLKNPGDSLFVLGETRNQLGGSAFERLVGRNLGPSPLAEPEQAMPLYRALHRAIRRGWVNACHDVSEGGLAVALCEAALGGRLGADVEPGLTASPGLAASPGLTAQMLLFSETPSRFVVSCGRAHERRLLRCFRGLPIRYIGKVTDAPRVRFRLDDRNALTLSLQEIETAWKTRI
jgi:phosphoribosylformylglycinamidine synthase